MKIIVCIDNKDNALVTGKYIMSRLEELKVKYPTIGDVRGVGLFIGIEFIKTNHRKVKNKQLVESHTDAIEPNAELAKFIIDFMRYENVIGGYYHPIVSYNPVISYHHPMISYHHPIVSYYHPMIPLYPCSTNPFPPCPFTSM